MGSLLNTGDTCWRKARARRAAVLVDGETYFAAVREAVKNARHSVRILAWDIDSRLELVRDGREDGWPTRLGPLLKAALARTPGLHIYILTWDFALIYAFERQWLPFYVPHWLRHPRLHLKRDDRHPVGGSQHQKVVVVDDRIAFSGGFDLSRWRWDTPAHRAGDERRVDAGGDPYSPFHDVQMLVDGEAAGVLGELARWRWARVTGRRPRPAGDTGTDPWPAGCEPDFNDVDIAISRTWPQWGDETEVREVERLFLATIAGARRWLYCENQFLTSRCLTHALAESLAAAQGPEIVIVLPRRTGAWLEQHTMDVVRARMLEQLTRADRHGRLRLLYPEAPGLGRDRIIVHSKISVVDDSLLRVGSANLSERSMGLDSECDLSLESAGDPRIAAAVTRVHARLLAEHLGAETDTVRETLERTSSLLATIDALNGGERRLRPLEWEVEPDVERMVPDSHLIDPPGPVEPEQLAAELVEPDQRSGARRYWIAVAAALLAVTALVLAWRWTPLSQWVDPVQLQRAATAITDGPAGTVVALTAFVVVGSLGLPVSALIVATGLTYGPWLGFVYSMVGSTLSALVSYWVGRGLGRRAVHRLAGHRVRSLSRRLARRGILSVVVLRVVPVAPFAVINLVAGASQLKARDLVIGTAVGMIPGVLAMTVFAEGLARAVQNPNWLTIGAVSLGLAAVVGIIALLRKWLRGHGAPQQD